MNENVKKGLEILGAIGSNITDEQLKRLLKNLEVLKHIDLHENFDIAYEQNLETQKELLMYKEFMYELVSCLEIEDNVIFELTKTADQFKVDKILEMRSQAESFNVNNKFKTLVEQKAELFKDYFGEEDYKIRKEKLERQKLKEQKIENRKKLRTRKRSRQMEEAARYGALR